MCLFPCNSNLELVGTFQIPSKLSGTIHNVSAVGFFAMLSICSLFLFTKSDGNPTENKKKRNIIYRVCGIGMVASFLILLLPYFYIQIWLVEFLALLFFGVSWLTKADCLRILFADPK